MIKRLKSLISNRSPIRLGWHWLKAFLAAARYGFPARRLTVIGITGTDGKTTTVGMVTHILHAAGKKVGAASTAYLQKGEEKRENKTHLTSINPFVLQKFLRELVSEAYEYAVIEVSSHGLVQSRSSFTWPRVAAITNLTPESLEYHKTMEQYRADKGLLFSMLRGKGTQVLNGADESCSYYQSIPSAETILYNKEEGDLWMTDATASESEVSGTLHTNLGGSVPLKLQVPGLFNLENAQCAIGCCSALGIPLETSVKALENFQAVAGRLQRIEEGQGFSVYVDFTVTPAAYKSVLTTLRKSASQGRVLVLFGCIGNRMKEKRHMIAQTCSELADVVVVTEDETYGEDPHAVHDETWSHIDQSACEAHNIFDRREAIAFILSQAKSGDAVAICGMGPFTTFKKIDREIEWDDREVVREELRKLK